MAYTITITSDSPQALAFVKEAKKLDFEKVTKIKETKIKEKDPIKTKKEVKKSMPAFEEETEEQYEAIMELSKIANRNIAHKLAKAKNLAFIK
jgi:hypothetical protein